MWRVVPATLWFLLALTSCGGSNQDKYAQAAAGLGLGVAATGINRAVTKDCWARCSPGYLCNETSGLCERGECYPGCEAGMHCVRDARDFTYCARDAAPAPPPKTPSSPEHQPAQQTYPATNLSPR